MRSLFERSLFEGAALSRANLAATPETPLGVEGGGQVRASSSLLMALRMMWVGVPSLHLTSSVNGPLPTRPTTSICH